MLALVFFGAVYSCSGTSDDDEQYVADELGVTEDEAAEIIANYGNAEDAIDDYRADAREPFDEDAAREAAEDEMANSGYDYSFGCTDDCSGHEAGWRWRADNGYTTPGNSNSFYEGGQAFDNAVEERVDEMRDEYESGEEPGY